MTVHERAQVIAYVLLLALIIASQCATVRLRRVWQSVLPGVVAVVGSVGLWLLGLFPGA